MKQNIIIIDDFYKNPKEVRDFSIQVEYPDPGNDYTYPGKNSKQNFYSKEIHQKFEDLVKTTLTPAPNNGYFRISLEKDAHKQDIHIDPSWEWGAVIYMTSPDYCVDEGGTSFWRHNTLNYESSPDNDQEAQFYGYSSHKESWWTTVYGDGLDRSKWTRYLLCPMKYNRMVLFRTNLWHSHNYNFGDSLENGRLVQLFFFNPIESW
jgi:hypothetical protein